MTNDLIRRVMEHRSGKGSKFTSRYKVVKLVYYETTDDNNSAIECEKQIKAGSRQKKIDLVEQINPEWNDLLEDLLPS